MHVMFSYKVHLNYSLYSLMVRVLAWHVGDQGNVYVAIKRPWLTQAHRAHADGLSNCCVNVQAQALGPYKGEGVRTVPEPGLQPKPEHLNSNF